MKIGIGITTMGVRDIHYDRYLLGVDKETISIVVHEDEERLGPAKAKNRCMKKLYDVGCDAMFLFDDDCYPQHPGWMQYILSHAREHDIHYLGLPEAFKSRPMGFSGELLYWDSILGCFHFQTRALIDKIGGYNEVYDRYGYEDCGRNYRAQRSGLAGSGIGHASLLRMPSYIYSEDVYGVTAVQNLTREEKDFYIAKNQAAFEQEIHGARIYYPFG